MVVDTLKTRYLADTKDYEAGNARVAALSDGLTSKFSEVQQAALRVAQAYGAMNGAIMLLSGTSLRSFANFDALTKSLQSIEGSAIKAGESLKVLKDIAKLPGLGLEEAIAGFSGLRMQGLNQAQSERILRATGNANAIMGGGRDELARVLQTIQKMLGTQFLQGDEVNQLAEARLPGRRALVNAFGTSDTEELKRRGITAAQAVEAIISELEKMPKAMDSPKNQMENLGVAFNQIMVQIGSGLSVYILPHLQAFGAALERLINADVFSVVGESLANYFSAFEGLSNGMTTWEGAIIAVTAATAGAIDAMANINRALITIAKNPMVQLAAAMIGVAVGPVGVIGGTAFAGLSGFIDSSLERAQQMSQKVRDHERYGTGGISSFLGQGMEASLAGFTMGGNPEVPGMAAAEDMNRKSTNHLAAIESNTRAMVDLQRHILGGGNIGAMGVTPIELSDIRRGGTGEEMVMSGIRKMMLEMGVSSFGRRGMVR